MALGKSIIAAARQSAEAGRAIAGLYDRWAPASPPDTVLMGEVGRVLGANAETMTDEYLRAVFMAAEEVLAAGSDAERDCVATGLIEGLASAVERRPEVANRMRRLMGPLSVEYWIAWARF